MQIVCTSAPSDDILSDVISGDSVLWLTDKTLSDQAEVDVLTRLVRAPWRAIYIESTSGELAEALGRVDSIEQTDPSASGFTHLISSDPASITLQRRACPIFLLNGRSDKTGSDSASLSERSALRRRLNMTARLRELEPKRIVLAGSNPVAALEDIVDLWGSEFRALVTVVSENQTSTDEVSAVLGRSTDLGAIHWITQSVSDFAVTLAARLELLATTSRTLVKVLRPSGIAIDVDIAPAELLERPISDSCDFIQVRDMLPVSPQDLSDDEFRAFFTRSDVDWRAFAAGLPWMPDHSPQETLLRKLNKHLTEPPGTVQVFSIVSEPGAGGTTQARTLAFAAARAGFPTILVKQHSEVPTALEVTNFLFRSLSAIQDAAAAQGDSDGGEPQWLLVLDVQHFGRVADDLWRFCADLSRSGRNVSILKVVDAEAPLQPAQSIDHTELLHITHNLGPDDVSSLGLHLNVFLRNLGREKTETEWHSFWVAHRPDIDTGIASFWIALEFWLAGYMELGESIQGWALNQFKSLSATPEVKQALLEIAALSIERRALPERLLANLQTPRLPWLQVLEDARREVPGLGFTQSKSVPYGRVWAIAHDTLARYLINAVWNDRPFAESIGVDLSEDPVALRIALIKRVAGRASFGESFARPFAIALATQILKLDEYYGNAEFFQYWRRLLEVLEEVPSSIKQSNRTFNHHLAISRRRVTQGDIFHLDSTEKKQMLLKAVTEVEFALEKIDPTPDDENDLNLLNTLALLYQDLAGLERDVFRNQQELARFLLKSDEVTRRALKENPNNSYVLETAAKNLLRQHIDLVDELQRVEAAAEALSYVFQASRLESADARRMSLGQLANEALHILRTSSSETAIERLCGLGSAHGFIAKAWRTLPEPDDDGDLMLANISPVQASGALDILKSSPERDWLLVRLQYDLEVIATPADFGGQLRVLDELADTPGYRLSLQQRLERAVLLHQEGRHKAASDEFRMLRRDIKASQAIVFVPDRLRWMLTPDRSRRSTCSARVVDSSSGRPMARVTELGGLFASFNVQEFGKARMAPNEHFKCQVTFSAMGPFLKPIDSGHRISKA